MKHRSFVRALVRATNATHLDGTSHMASENGSS
jgi:hypothetical protein